MSFNFPSLPYPGQVFSAPGGPNYVYDGTAWRVPTSGTLVPPEPGPHYQSKADLEAATVPDTALTLTIDGYTTPGDGRAGMYRRVVSEPSHAYKIQSFDGAWWELIGAFINPMGPSEAPNFVSGQSFNRLHAAIASSMVLGGTSTQPQHIGKQVYRTTFAGDGVTIAFPVTPGFVVNDVEWLNIRANKVILSTGGLFSYSDGAGFSVAGYGTGTITITMDAAPTTDHLLEIVVIGESDDGAATPTLAATLGYDNVVSSIMSLALGAHNLLFTGDGHNSALGGSFNRLDGSYGATLGQFNQIGLVNVNSTFCYAVGQSNRADGHGSGALGVNNWVNGIGSWAIGADSDIGGSGALNDVYMIGRRGRAQGVSEFVQAGGKTTDPVRTGYHQSRRQVLARDTTDAVVASMTNTTGSSSILLPNKSVALAKVRVSACNDLATKFIIFEGTFLVSKDGAGNALVNNLTTDVTVPAVANIGAPTWIAAARALAGSLVIRVTGAAGENVRWTAEVTLIQGRWP